MISTKYRNKNIENSKHIIHFDSTKEPKELSKGRTRGKNYLQFLVLIFCMKIWTSNLLVKAHAFTSWIMLGFQISVLIFKLIYCIETSIYKEKCRILPMV